MTYEETLEAIQQLFDNTGYSLEEALENMQGLRDEISDKINLLKADLGQ